MEKDEVHRPAVRDGLSDTPRERKQFGFVQKLVYLKPFLALILVRLPSRFISNEKSFGILYIYLNSNVGGGR
jgi:hypothetical protein